MLRGLLPGYAPLVRRAIPSTLASHARPSLASLALLPPRRALRTAAAQRHALRRPRRHPPRRSSRGSPGGATRTLRTEMLAIQTSLETIEARIAQLNPSAAAAAAAGVGGPAALLTSVDGTMREAWAQSVRSIDRWEKHLNASLPLKPEWLPAKYLRVAVFGVVFVIGGTAGTYYLIGARWKKIAAEEVADLAEQVLAQRALKATVLATLDELAQDPETLLTLQTLLTQVLTDPETNKAIVELLSGVILDEQVQRDTGSYVNQSLYFSLGGVLGSPWRWFGKGVAEAGAAEEAEEAEKETPSAAAVAVAVAPV